MTPQVRLGRARTELETRGLTRGTHRRGVRGWAQQGFGERLAGALSAVGPLYSLFGHYLAGRTDRVKLNDCRELARLRISADPTPMGRVGALLDRQLEGPVDDHFSSVAEAGRTTLLHQWHEAELVDGTSVTVKVVRPEALELVDRELELLPLLEELAIDDRSASPLIEDFVVWLDRRLDLEQETAGLERLAGEVETFDAFEVPTVVSELCGRHVSVTHRTGGTPLDTILDTPWDHRPRLARRLCQAWLQQSLLEGACPEGPLPENVLILSSERSAITGGLVTGLDSGCRDHLLEILIATARHDPDRVCDALLAECDELEGAADRLSLRSALRQAESFRSGGWTDDSSVRRISDELFVYWRVATGLGYQSRRHTVAFIRGFTELDSAARTLSPDTDVLADAIDDLRMVAAASKIRRHLGPGALVRAVEELVPVVDELLEQPDRLTRWFHNDRDGGGEDTMDSPRRTVSWQRFAGSLAVLASVTVLGVTVIRSNPDRGWLEWLVALGFAAAAVGVFRLVGTATER